MKKNVQMKGTKDGIQIFLSDTASIQELKAELISLLEEQKPAPYSGEKLAVQVQIGNRLFSEEEEAEIANIIIQNSQMKIGAFYSNVMTKADAKKWKESDQIYSLATIIRSGQIVQVKGDVLLIGDINPGGQIRSSGNIFVLGHIKGIVHAGFEGNKDAVVAGKFLYPSQVRIADKFFGFDSEDYKEVADTELFSAFINKDEIVIDDVHKIRKIRPEISNYEGGR
ncbi:septum site-determining protein MinC [Listeria fleischmannii]|jgi:septum site-determining protein MinC|uniref:Probable septum site-determining protein MinC n=1 Tax=Listeria fleischmannii TaxID=1069827 RepID=A0A841YBA8_9LIST|nr:septum site-determining protein MinC [Listeria fleischmannii]EIA21354.1 septum formation inhibitor [Listeria fleischmannii subsp. coloradonensis]MBC1397555.1 septum site-determining protein MinC [Listeria fleischmannii]MBC1418307.1 septum site-determining protein MinC [Listeria fleischmannii]MBC1425924.1 septum site-determining protein MinC [Listeria fleischmannii]STY35055.1 Septum site-determining protein MinC [Listeria fleischmannii subsp. coloradonensis]